MPVDAVRPLRDPERGSRFHVRVDRSTRVTLPVACYPGMLRVTIGRDAVAYGQDQQFTTILVPPGRHVVRVGFVGLPWANAASLAGVAAAIALTLGGWWHRRRGRSRR